MENKPRFWIFLLMLNFVPALSLTEAVAHPIDKSELSFKELGTRQIINIIDLELSHLRRSLNWLHLELQITKDSVTFSVKGACSSCKTRIENASKAEGLQKADWNMESQLLTLIFDKAIFNVEDAKNRILGVGHDVENHVAPDDIYKKLSSCCNYRDKSNVHQQKKEAQHHDHSGHDHIIKGVVMQENAKGELSPIAAVSVYWLEQPKHVVQTNAAGAFQIDHKHGFSQLVIKHVGHQADTLTVTDLHKPIFVTAKGNVLQEVSVNGARKSNYIDKLNPNRLEVITKKELHKAACCDLSESFETNASVDVVNTDAVTGSKQIQMLGLSGIYTQLTVENLPGPTGLSMPLGLNSIAGTWIESIQIGKGIGSVVNGFEDIAGQINVELKKPDASEKLFFNAYANSAGRTDVNLNAAHQINDRWSVGLLLHDNFMYNKRMDFSDNGFRDMPIGNLFSAVNRWKYQNENGLLIQFGAKFLKDNRTGGELDFDRERHKFMTEKYGLGFDIDRYELFTKIGYTSPQHPYRSVGLLLSGSAYDQKSFFGLRSYDAAQRSGFANLIYQDRVGSDVHTYKTGLSLRYDRYEEDYAIVSKSDQRFERTEQVSGAFLEYKFSPSERFDAILGIRGDHNNLYGWFATPRIHMRYQPFDGSSFRLSAGRGQRTANVIAENIAALASSRNILFRHVDVQDKAYGLRPEIAWNLGISFDQSFRLFQREAAFSVEYFRTNFTDQVIVDYENPRELSFYNLEGKSYSNSFQTEFRCMPLPHFEARMAYRLLDVKSTYDHVLLQRPLMARHRGFLNLAYSPHSGGWSFDYTLNLTGQKRLPSTATNPVAYQLPDSSPSYMTMNAQISKKFGKVRPFEIYIGGENLTNYFQQNPVLAADQPFGENFDTSLVWGPVTGRLFYMGIRFGIDAGAVSGGHHS